MFVAGEITGVMRIMFSDAFIRCWLARVFSFATIEASIREISLLITNDIMPLELDFSNLYG